MYRKLLPMILRTILGLLIVLIVCSCNQQPSKNGQQSENGTNQNLKAKSGLEIEYGPNLGTGHTDTFGTKYFYVHSTAIITNDSTIPIHLQFALASLSCLSGTPLFFELFEPQN